MSKHTPGPWVALAVNLTGRRGARYPLAIYQEATQNRICTVLDDDLVERDDRTVADANLIAAAPDLLALAKQYASECGDCNGTGLVTIHRDGADYDDQPCASCADIRAVIEKAEGK